MHVLIGVNWGGSKGNQMLLQYFCLPKNSDFATQVTKGT
jgi:hypothetical protein